MVVKIRKTTLFLSSLITQRPVKKGNKKKKKSHLQHLNGIKNVEVFEDIRAAINFMLLWEEFVRNYRKLVDKNTTITRRLFKKICNKSPNKNKN